MQLHCQGRTMAACNHLMDRAVLLKGRPFIVLAISEFYNYLCPDHLNINCCHVHLSTRCRRWSEVMGNGAWLFIN